jgi:hypothetical protein
MAAKRKRFAIQAIRPMASESVSAAAAAAAAAAADLAYADCPRSITFCAARGRAFAY